jgi:hypothetical protein
MAMSPVEQARYRKLIYAGLIILLFTLLVIYRQLGVVERAADRYGIAETNLGKTDLGGSAARFLLASFRGPLICSLWWEAIDLQMRHDWHEMEIVIKSLTKLQPHFRSTWEYQGWNLAYNVSVEFDRVQDKYFYVAEGIKWTTNGEKINRAQLYDPKSPTGKRIVGDPQLRWSIGFFLQDKLSVSDEINTYRCFWPLSCIPPKEWAPAAFRRDPQNLKDFKRDHPQLVQRIRILKHIPEEAETHLDEEIQSFTAALFRPEFPSLYPQQLAGKEDVFVLPGSEEGRKFPVWPSPDPTEVVASRLRLALEEKDKHPWKPEVHDSHEIARLWFEYSLAPLPPPNLDLTTLDPDERRLYRMPQRMVSLIFRSNPARAKGLMGARLYREGWFEEGQRAWAEAYEMWRDHGRDNGLELDPDEQKALEERAVRFSLQYPAIATGATTELPPHAANDEKTLADYAALRRLRAAESRLNLGNYKHWRVSSEVNMTPAGVQAWRHLYNGKERYKSDLHLARAEYEKGLDAWRKLLSTDKGRGEALLGLGADGANIGFILQSRPFFQPTALGFDKQFVDELIPFQDEYLGIRARCEAPKWLLAGCDLWQCTQLWTQQAASPITLVGPVGCMPAPLVPLSLQQAQLMLMDPEGPLDPYLDELTQAQRKAAKTRPTPSQVLDAQLPSQAQPGPATRTP